MIRGRTRTKSGERASFAASGKPPDPLDTLETMVAAAFAVPVRKLRAGKRGPARIAFARQSAMYLAHVVFGLSCTDVGLLFGRDRTTAAHAFRVVEDRRSDPVFDQVLTVLESGCARPRATRNNGVAA
jgi:chromosomal replication initiation ATPase DnaA